MDIEKLVSKYVQLRDKKSELEAKHREELAPIKKYMQDIEVMMLKQMGELNTTSLKTTAGTAYQTKRTSATVADRELFRSYCLENDAWELADIRAGKSAIAAMVEETGDLPPGINWREELGVNFKR